MVPPSPGTTLSLLAACTSLLPPLIEAGLQRRPLHPLQLPGCLRLLPTRLLLPQHPGDKHAVARVLPGELEAQACEAGQEGAEVLLAVAASAEAAAHLHP